jgi:hypothetical protein
MKAIVFLFIIAIILILLDESSAGKARTNSKTTSTKDKSKETKKPEPSRTSKASKGKLPEHLKGELQKNFYERLGISKKAKDREIKKAYRTLAKKVRRLDPV